jgi:hypothetical protein
MARESEGNKRSGRSEDKPFQLQDSGSYNSKFAGIFSSLLSVIITVFQDEEMMPQRGMSLLLEVDKSTPHWT